MITFGSLLFGGRYCPQDYNVNDRSRSSISLIGQPRWLFSTLKINQQNVLSSNKMAPIWRSCSCSIARKHHLAERLSPLVPNRWPVSLATVLQELMMSELQNGRQRFQLIAVCSSAATHLQLRLKLNVCGPSLSVRVSCLFVRTQFTAARDFF